MTAGGSAKDCTQISLWSETCLNATKTRPQCGMHDLPGLGRFDYRSPRRGEGLQGRPEVSDTRWTLFA